MIHDPRLIPRPSREEVARRAAGVAWRATLDPDIPRASREGEGSDGGPWVTRLHGRDPSIMRARPSSPRPGHRLKAAAAAGAEAGSRPGRWRLLLPGASGPRPTVLTRRDFKSVFQTAYAA